MGKKEQIIKKKINEYYENANKDENNIKEITKKKEQQYETELREQQELDKFEKTVYKVKQSMQDYIKNQGLCLLENMEYENLENYIKFVLTGCYPKKKQAVVTQPMEDYTESFTSTYEESTSEKDTGTTVTTDKELFNTEEDKKFKDNVIISLGKNKLESEYIEFTEGKGDEISLHENLKKQFGDESYYKLIKQLGEEIYSTL